MPLSSSYHDYAGSLSPSARQRDGGAGSPAAPSRSAVHPVQRDAAVHRLAQAHHTAVLRQPSPEVGGGGGATVVLGTASIAAHRAGEAPRSRSLSVRDASTSAALPQPLLIPHSALATSAPVSQQQQQQRRDDSQDNRSSVTSSRRPHRSAQPLPSSLSPSVLTSATAARSTAPVSPRLAHLRPLSTSREADYLSLAPQRGFTGRFRCAVPVVVCTAAALSSHTPASPRAEEAVVAGVDGPDTREEPVDEEAPVPVEAAARDDAGQPPDPTRDEADGLGVASGAVGQRTRRGGSSVLMRPRLSLSGGTAPSVVSGAATTARRGHPALSPTGGRRAAGASASVAPSTQRRRSAGSASLSVVGLRMDASASLPHAVGGVPAANMEPLVKSGLHTTLWAAGQDGGLEVRSMANPSQVVASLPRREGRAIITALADVGHNRVVAGLTDGTLRLFDAVTLREVGDEAVHTAAITRLLYVSAAPPATGSRDPSLPRALLLAGSLDRTISVWAAATMTLLHRLKGNTRGISALAATSTGGYAFSGSDEGTIRMWDLVEGAQWAITKEERAQLMRHVYEGSPAGAAGAPLLTSRDKGRRSSSSSSSSSDASAEDSSSSDEEGERAGAGKRLSGAAVSPPGRLTASLQRSGSSQRRTLASYGGVKLVSRVAAGSPSHIRRVAQRSGSGVGAAAAAAGAQSRVSARSLEKADENFAPTDTATTSSPMRDADGPLAGRGGGISPLRPALEADSAAPNAAEAGSVYRRLGKDHAATTSTTAAHSRKGKAKKKKAGAEKAAEKSAKKKKKTAQGEAAAVAASGSRTKTKKAKKASAKAAGASASTTARLSIGALEQRLGTWIHLYTQRVLLSAASCSLVARLPAGYDRATAVNWPIDCSHIEYVSALAVVEDRLLVSASCDATAKVFALPSGQYVRTLTSARRMPLAGVLYDSGLGRIYTAFSDGAVAVYDLTSAELPLMTQLQSPQTILSCTFAAVAATPMHRFVLGAAGASADGSSYTSVVSIAQYDKTTLAHGPHLTTSTYRVGQPSLRELNAAVSLQPLQQQRVADRLALAKRGSATTLEELRLREDRRCGKLLAHTHAAAHAVAVLARWRCWARRRAVLRHLTPVADSRAEQAREQLRGRCWQRWLTVARQRAQAKAADVLRSVQLRGSDSTLLSVAAEVRGRRWKAHNTLAVSMARQLDCVTLRRAFRLWRELQRSRQSERRQSVSFNTLFLLSIDAGAYSPSCCALQRLGRHATRRAHHAKALWLLAETTQRVCAQQQRSRFFGLWRAFAQEQRQQRAQYGEAWSLVEPLSATLVRHRVLRHRYFALWRDFALFVARGDQLRGERETLQSEWATLRRAVETPASVEELRAAALAATAAAATAREARAALAERLQTLSDEDSTLHTEEALRVLIAGYYVPDAAATRATAGAVTPRSASATAPQPRGSDRASVASSVDNGGGVRARGRASAAASVSACAAESAPTEAEQRDRRVLMEVSAVLRALKGNCMQCARDDKLLVTAHALALRLPIFEAVQQPAVSVESSPSRRAGPQLTQRRTTTWSVSNAKSGGSTAVLTAQQQQQHQRRRQPGLPSTSLPSGSAVVPTAAQMWAAQPAPESYASLADAFCSIYDHLMALLYSAAMEGGVPPGDTSRSTSATLDLRSRATREAAGGEAPQAGSADEPTDSTRDGLQAPTMTPSWLAQVPLKQRRVMVGEVLKLVTLFDSFAAHSDLPVERSGSISTRGVANTRALPLSSLCTHETAQSLLRHAAVLLELVDPQLWPRQVRLNYLQDAYAAAIAELNATVTSSRLSDAAPHASTVVTGSESEGRDGSVAPAPLVMRPPTLCLSPDVLQRAADRMQRGADYSSATSVSDGAATHQSEQRTPASALATAPQPHGHPRLPLPALDPSTQSKSSGGGDERLNGTLRSAEEDEGATPTPDPQRAHSPSFSHRTFSAVSTPRSYTPRTATSSVAAAPAAAAGLLKPYLGFRVVVTRDTQPSRRSAPTISIRDVAARYVNGDGAEEAGPALVAGLQAGDQLVRFAGYAVTDLAAFNAVVARHVHSGAELPVVVQRGEELLSATIVVGTRSA